MKERNYKTENGGIVLRCVRFIATLILLSGFSGMKILTAGDPLCYITSWGGAGTGDGKFQSNNGITVGIDGNIYVADQNNNRIQKFSGAGVYISKWGALGNGDGQFHNPVGVAADAGGNIYVSDSSNDRIQKFDSSGSFITKWGTYGNANGQFSGPGPVAVDNLGYVYVIDGFERVQKFSSSGVFILKWGSHGSAAGQFNYPQGIAADNLGNIFIADSGHNRILKFSNTGTYLGTWGVLGAGAGELSGPSGIVVNNIGDIYITDENNSRIQQFSSAGVFIAEWGVLGTGAGQFSYPSGITADSAGIVYVSDSGNNRVQKFDVCPGMTPVFTPSGTNTITPVLSSTEMASMTPAMTASYTAVSTPTPTITVGCVRPDLSFNSTGAATHNGAAEGNSHDSGNAVAVGADGKIVVAGYSWNPAGNMDMAVWRYNRNGSLDTAFNTTGYFTHHNAAGGNGNDNAYCVAIDANGRILAAGTSRNPAGNPSMVVWRINSDGTPDTAFKGTGFGVFIGSAGSIYGDVALGITTDSSGKILITGNGIGPVNGDMVIWRLMPDGSLDTSFGGTGIVVFSYTGFGNGDDEGIAIKTQPDGRIIVAGTITADYGYDMALWRYNQDGSLDLSFNGTGYALHDSAAGGGSDIAYSVALDTAGDIFIAGHSNLDMAIWKYKNNGTLDTTFNGIGFNSHGNAAGGNGVDGGNGIALDTNGNALITGISRNISGKSEMVIWRYSSTGLLDTAFNGTGFKRFTAAAGGNEDWGMAVIIYDNNSIIAAGGSMNPAGNGDLAIWGVRDVCALYNTRTFTPTLTPTNTSVITPSETVTITRSLTFTPTASETASLTSSNTASFTETPELTNTFTPDVTPSLEYTATKTNTVAAIPGNTSTVSPSLTATITATPAPNAVEISQIKVSPNPSNGIYSLMIPDGYGAQKYIVSVYSLDGTLYKKYHFEKSADDKYAIDIADAAGGIYVLVINFARENKTVRYEIIKIAKVE